MGIGCPFLYFLIEELGFIKTNASPTIVSTLPHDWQTSSEVSVSTYIFSSQSKQIPYFSFFIFYAMYIQKFKMEKRLESQYYSPNGYWKGFGAIKKLAQAAKVSENVSKRWLFKQALWQI